MYLPFLSQGSTTTGIRTAPHAAVFYEFGNTLFRCDFCSVLNWSIDLRLGVVGLTLTSDCGFSMCIPSSVTRQERNSFSSRKGKKEAEWPSTVHVQCWRLGDVETHATVLSHPLRWCCSHTEIACHTVSETRLHCCVECRVKMCSHHITPKENPRAVVKGSKVPQNFSPLYLSSRPQILS